MRGWMLVVGIAVLCVAGSGRGEEGGADGQTAEAIKVAESEVRFLQALPENYEEKEKWPLLIFLHGGGERGDDLEALKKHGPPMLIAEGKKFPMIVVSPQCPKDKRWDAKELDAWLAKLMETLRVDRDRVYLTGISMGGYGTWAWASSSPERFAAIAPICGGGDPEKAGALMKIPTWVVHGQKDEAVPVARSEAMVEAIKKAGGEPKFTVYPDEGHESWKPFYADEAFYDWLLEQSRGKGE